MVHVVKGRQFTQPYRCLVKVVKMATSTDFVAAGGGGSQGIQPMDLGLTVQQTAPIDIKQFLDTTLAEDALESAFHGCLKRVLIPERREQLNLPEKLKSIFTTSPKENLPVYLDQYVNYIADQSNHQRVASLLQVLRSLIAQGHLKPGFVCESLVRHLNLSGNALVWSETLDLVQEIVGGVHYKGCRELMKLLFDKFDHVPRQIPEEQVVALLKGQKLLAYILDRNSSLLPAYFAHDAIRRHYPDKGNTSPHWVLQKVIDELQNSMRSTADLVSGIVQPHLRPVLGISNVSLSVWRLDPTKQCCALKGMLPYKQSLLSPQRDVLYHVIAQQNSKDAIHSILGLNRQQLQPSELVEGALVRLCMAALQLSESVGSEGDAQFGGQAFEAWSHFASQMVFCYFLQLINFTSLLNKLRVKLSHSKLRKGKDWLMWSLLHFSSTVQSKQPGQIVENEFVPIINLFSLLYKDRQPLPVPDASSPSCMVKMAAAGVWVVYSNKTKADGLELPRPLPYILTKQIEWMNEQCESPPPSSELSTNFTVPLLLNVYSNTNDVINRLLTIMLEAMVPPSSASTSQGGGGGAKAKEATPIPLKALNLIAMHPKIRLMEMVKTHLIKVVESFKQVPAPADTASITPSLLETYSRLLVWLGTRNFQSHLIPAVFKSQAWGVLHALLEIIVFRVHLQLQYSYRFQLLQQLHTVASVSIIPSQLYSSTENAALRLIKGLVSSDFLIQLAKQFSSDPKPLLSTDSEELNRIFVLVVAQSLQISNIDTTNWLEPFMRQVLTTAPNYWSEGTLACFPSALRQFCVPPSLGEQRQLLLSQVDEETRKFLGHSSEMEQTRLFTETDSAHLFLCVLWKLLLKNGTVNPVLVKVAQRTQPKKLAAFMRKMADYVIFTLPEQLDNAADHLNKLVWEYTLFPLDRLVMCMMVRGYEESDSKRCLQFLHQLLIKSEQLSQRVDALVKQVPADYWNQPNWCKQHAEYLEQFPESFQPEIPSVPPSTKPPGGMPMYFGNCCLRFLPVFDLLIQRFLEVADVASECLEPLLIKYGPLYKFHDQPLSFLYTTLHCYEPVLSQHPSWKKALIGAVIDSQGDVHRMDWYFTTEMTRYISSEGGGDSDGESWTPSQDYFTRLLEKLVRGLQPFNLNTSVCDWHFSEFSSCMNFALYCCCVELMALPLPGKDVARQLIEAVYTKAGNSSNCEENEILEWINALGLMLVSLPDCYHTALYNGIEEVVSSCSSETSPPLPKQHSVYKPYHLSGCLLSLVHAFWLHANLGLLVQLPHWMQSTLRPIVKNEWQLLYVCHLIGPILNRLTSERPKLLLEVVIEIYYLLELVDKQQEGRFQNSDIICDFLYHIKYMHIGDREEIESVITTLNMPLKLRLKFLCPSLSDPAQTPATAHSQPLASTMTS